jgi:hypothetical protein
MQVTPSVHTVKEGEEIADENAPLNDYLIP